MSKEVVFFNSILPEIKAILEGALSLDLGVPARRVGQYSEGAISKLISSSLLSAQDQVGAEYNLLEFDRLLVDFAISNQIVCPKDFSDLVLGEALTQIADQKRTDLISYNNGDFAGGLVFLKLTTDSMWRSKKDYSLVKDELKVSADKKVKKKDNTAELYKLIAVKSKNLPFKVDHKLSSLRKLSLILSAVDDLSDERLNPHKAVIEDYCAIVLGAILPFDERPLGLGNMKVIKAIEILASHYK